MQNLDEPQEEESDKVLFEHFLGCYTAFHHGRDDYREELDALKENFMRIYEVDDEVGAELVSPKLQMSQFSLVLCNLIFGPGNGYKTLTHPNMGTQCINSLFIITSAGPAFVVFRSSVCWIGSS